MTEEKTMGITRARTMEWNLNTVIQLITLAGMCIGGVTIWVDKSRDIEELQNWRGGHETLHKDRLAEVKTNEARVEERFKGLEADSRKVASQVDNLAYRVTVTEQTTTSTASARRAFAPCPISQSRTSRARASSRDRSSSFA
ncbi:hypothetical protein KYK30_21870 [Shinella yambaruensis]|uniref:Uncharacterized protein n=1 Tax=Shinella yambaruensis TaxID=415996 RepID=A0ABQ5ZJL4_9HYPH|nr:hypothetical protein [Shinella yambaruensis]MCJ8026559.1 hypothetical protein [Shinella yambaruensis]MCU7982353.1 hypothetical protein [Shinella yambaruensis]GLR51826.1 hypothetical protein GCM10007923_30360 [Shinella yambaruensis]